MTGNPHDAGKGAPREEPHGNGARNASVSPGNGAHVQRSPMIGSARFARSTRDSHVHVLAPAGEHPTDRLTARCGHVLPTDAIEHDQPSPGPPCEPCRLMFLEDFAADDRDRKSVV